MQFISITDIETPELQIYKQLRDKTLNYENSFIADSPKVVNELLRTDLEIKSILATQEYYDEFAELIKSKHIATLYVASKELMQDIVGHKIHHNVMAHGVRPKQVVFENLGNHIIMLNEITSTENIGSIARSAAAIGVNSYLVPTQGPHPYSRRALRVSMGHVSKLNVHLYDNILSTIKHIQENGYKVFAAEVTEDSIPLMDVKVPERWVLLMGHEGKGLSKDIIELCDATVQIEMEPDIRSFNVAVAASIIMYRFKNRRD